MLAACTAALSAVERILHSLTLTVRPRVTGLFLAALALTALPSGCTQTAPPAVVRPAYLPPEALEADLLAIAEREDRRTAVDEGLLKYVGSPTPELRARVARALGRLQDPAGANALATLAGDAVPGVRREAYFALGQIFPPGSDDAPQPQSVLASRFSEEPELDLKAEIVRALGKIGNERAQATLLTAMQSQDPGLRGEAALAIGVQIYRKLAGPPSAEVVNQLTLLLRDVSPDVRWKTAYAFMRAPPTPDLRGRPRAILQELLFDSDVTVRLMAARALGELGDGATVEHLQRALNDSDWRVRVNALRAAGKLRGAVSLTALQTGLQDAHALVRQQALESLGNLGDPSAAGLIEPILGDDNADPAMQVAALGAYAALKGDAAFGSLMSFVPSTNPWVRSAAVTALGRLQSQEALDQLMMLAQQENDPRVMAAIADAIGTRPTEVTRAALLSLMARGDAAVVTVTAKLVGAHKLQEGLPYLLESFKRQTPVRDWESREAIVRALGELGMRDDRVRDLLIASAADPDGRVAQAAAESYRKLFFQELTPTPRAPRPPGNSYFEASRFKRAIVETEKGSIMLALLPEEAPLTVTNFVRLARQGFFSGLMFHRVVPNFVVQGGCPRGDGWGGPGYTIRCEVNPVTYQRGSVGMALSGKDTGGSQFFITHSAEPHLDGTYTVFGQVIEGMEVVDKLERGDIILSVRVPDDEE